jgi:hypothetical protein
MCGLRGSIENSIRLCEEHLGCGGFPSVDALAVLVGLVEGDDSCCGVGFVFDFGFVGAVGSVIGRGSFRGGGRRGGW